MSGRERSHRRGGKTAAWRSSSEKRKPSGSPTDSLPPKSSKPLVQSTMPDVFNFGSSTPKPSQHRTDEQLTQTENNDVSSPSHDDASHDSSYPTSLFNFINEASVDVLTTKLSRALMLPQLQDKFQQAFLRVAQDVMETMVKDMITPMKQEIHHLKHDLVEPMKQEIHELRKELHMKTDELEQYSRRNSIRISGIPESREENTEKLTMDVLKTVHQDITLSDVDRCHRVGKPTPGRNRQIIVKFVSFWDKRQVCANKKKLNRTRRDVYINEDLTQHRSWLFKMARDLKKQRKIEATWTSDGRIFVLEQQEGRIRVVQSKEDLDAYM